MSGDLDLLDFTRAFEYQWEHLATGQGVIEASKVKKAEVDPLSRDTNLSITS